MEYIDTILKIFPDAHIIQTHRDPQKTMASFISMVCHGVGVFSDTVDVPALSTHWQRKDLRLIDLSMQARIPDNDQQLIDIAYADLVADPVATLRLLYGQVGLAFDDDTQAHAQALLARQVKGKYGAHHYNAADFGMSHEQIERDFGAYRARYDIPHEDQDDD